jgi:hypothetical protein
MCAVSQESTAKYLIYHPQQGYGWRMPAGGLLTAAETEIFRVPEERLSEEYEILGTDAPCHSNQHVSPAGLRHAYQ